MTGAPPERSASLRDRIYDHYVTSGQSGDIETALSSRANFCRALIAKHFPEDRSIHGIDLGCGHGVLLHFAQEAGYGQLCGVDASAEQVEVARQLGIENVSQDDLWNALERTNANSQDLVLSFDIIEHMDKSDLVAFVDGVQRVLRHGGRWLILTPNGESPMFGRVRYADLTHELAFTRRSLEPLLLASGFDSVEFHEITPVAASIKGWVRLLLWKVIRAALRLYVAAETGDTGHGAIFTQNLLAVAYKEPAPGDPRSDPAKPS